MDKKNIGKDKMNTCGMCDSRHAGNCDDFKSCGGGMCCGGHGHGGCWRWVFKVIAIIIVVVAVVFSVSIFAVAVKILRFGYESSVVGPAGMMGWRGMMNNGWNWMMGGRNASAQAFGVVSSVNGQSISYTDNGGKTGTIISSSGTTIVSGNAYVGLGAIKAGQTISAYGTVNQAGELQATWIEVQ